MISIYLKKTSYDKKYNLNKLNYRIIRKYITHVIKDYDDLIMKQILSYHKKYLNTDNNINLFIDIFYDLCNLGKNKKYSTFNIYTYETGRLFNITDEKLYKILTNNDETILYMFAQDILEFYKDKIIFLNKMKHYLYNNFLYIYTCNINVGNSLNKLFSILYYNNIFNLKLDCLVLNCYYHGPFNRYVKRIYDNNYFHDEFYKKYIIEKYNKQSYIRLLWVFLVIFSINKKNHIMTKKMTILTKSKTKNNTLIFHIIKKMQIKIPLSKIKIECSYYF